MKTLDNILTGLTSSHREVTGTTVGNKRAADVNILDIYGNSVRSAFGDNLSDSLTPIEQISAQYGIDFENIETFTDFNGVVNETNNMFTCTTGVTPYGYGVIRTKKPTVYREGQGLMGRFTAIFDTNAALNSLQFAGLFNVQDTIAFGYRNKDFGILLDNYGAQEIRTLAITVSGNGNLSLTLNSVLYTIPITTGTIAHNCYEIRTWLNANQTVWDAQQIGDSVTLKGRSVGAKSGTYTVTGAGLTGSITQQKAGLAQTQTTILETEWNGETVTFDKSKGNVYMIKVSYLGFGPISFFILDPDEGRFKCVHTIKYNNNNIKPSVSNRSLKIGWVAASLGSVTSLTVQGASAATFIEGKSSKNILNHSQSFENTAVGNTFEAILSIKALQVFSNKSMLGRVVLQRLVISTDATKEVVFKICRNATLGETNYAFHEEGKSVVVYDTTAHADTTSAHALYQGQVSGGGDREVNLRDLNIDFYANESITFFAKIVSGAAANVTASVVWQEDI